MEVSRDKAKVYLRAMEFASFVTTLKNTPFIGWAMFRDVGISEQYNKDDPSLVQEYVDSGKLSSDEDIDQYVDLLMTMKDDEVDSWLASHLLRKFGKNPFTHQEKV